MYNFLSVNISVLDHINQSPYHRQARKIFGIRSRHNYYLIPKMVWGKISRFEIKVITNYPVTVTFRER